MIALRRGMPALALLAGVAWAASAAAVERPLWELGIGVAGLRLPHYRGSDQSHNWLLPAPYVVYRGEIFKADRDGARAVVFESDRVDIDLSLAASAPTRSGDNRARQGMADLAPSFEIGPNLNLTLARGAGWKLDLRAPLRAAVTFESRPQGIGWIATPNLNLDLTRLQGWNLGLQAGAVFASRRFNAHFYDVSLADATAQRPAYRSAGGGGGGQLTAALSRRLNDCWMGFFARFDSLQGARFVDSPLVRQRHNVALGFAVSWVLRTSTDTVSVAE